MKLCCGTTPPYVRKVRVTAIELGLNDRIDLENTLPWESDTTFGHINPLGKIPALVTDQGQLIHDSRVICEYFDEPPSQYFSFLIRRVNHERSKLAR